LRHQLRCREERQEAITAAADGSKVIQTAELEPHSQLTLEEPTCLFLGLGKVCLNGRLSVVRTFGTDVCLILRSVGLDLGLMLSGEFAVLQAAPFNCLSFDPFALIVSAVSACGPALMV
jgi:hypothetical protein